MSGDLYQCPNCGAALSLEQLRGTDCFYCKAAFPHHARAVEQAALVQQVMAQQMGAQGYAAPPPGAYVPHGYGVTPPAYGATPPPYGAAPPYGAPVAFTTAQANDLQKKTQKIVIGVVVGVLALAFLVVALGVVIAVALRP